MTARFREHEQFHKAALFRVIGGALGGLATYVSSSGGTAWAVAIVGGAAVAGAVVAFGGIRPAVAGLRGKKLVIAAAVAVGALLLARHTLSSIASARELATLPAWLVAMTAGIGFAMVSVAALVPRHLELAHDRVGDAFDAMRGGLTGEVKDLSQRGYDLWRRVELNLPDNDPTRATLEDAVLRLLGTARRWQAVESESPRTAAAGLAERMTELDRRIEKATDPVAKREYERARAALTEQLRYLEDIGKSRERVVARMHNYLAAMEQLRMASINVESTQASQSIQPLLTDLEALGREVADEPSGEPSGDTLPLPIG